MAAGSPRGRPKGSPDHRRRRRQKVAAASIVDKTSRRVGKQIRRTMRRPSARGNGNADGAGSARPLHRGGFREFEAGGRSSRVWRRLTEDGILATNNSSCGVTDLARGMKHRSACRAPLLITSGEDRLVEVTGGRQSPRSRRRQDRQRVMGRRDQPAELRGHRQRYSAVVNEAVRRSRRNGRIPTMRPRKGDVGAGKGLSS